MPQTLTGLMSNYYWNEVWKRYRPHVKNGVFINFYDKDHKPGDESPINVGALVGGNGGHLENQMEMDQLIKEEEVIESPLQVPGLLEFKATMEKFRKKDGMAIYDGAKLTLQHIGIVNPTAPKMAGITYSAKEELPKDYFTIDGLQKSLGGRGDISMRISKAYPWAEIFTISSSSYTKLGPGAMDRKRDGRLVERWALINPEKEGYKVEADIPWVDREKRVACLYRRYVDDDGNQKRDEQGNLIPVFEAFVNQNSRDKDGRYVCYQGSQPEHAESSQRIAPPNPLGLEINLGMQPDSA